MKTMMYRGIKIEFGTVPALRLPLMPERPAHTMYWVADPDLWLPGSEDLEALKKKIDARIEQN